MSLRLVARLLRGGGTAGLVRMTLMVCGIALGVAAGMLVAVMPGVLHGRAAVMNARTPRPAPQGTTPSFVFSLSTDVWDGKRLGRVFVADVRPETALPPGVRRLPGPHEVVASPALARRLSSDTALAALVPGRVIGTIDDAGLIGPNEFFAYIGMPPEGIAQPHAAAGFGSRDTLTLARQQTGLPESLALLVLPPVVVYLIVCARLAAATRVRRYAALRLLGMRRTTTLRIAFAESALSGAVGGVLGIGLFHAVHPVLAAGALGFSWFPQSVGLGTGLVVTVVVVVTLVAGLVGAAGVRRSLRQPLSARVDTTERKAHPWLLAPLAFGLGITLYLLVFTPHPVAEGDRMSMPGTVVWVAIGGIVLMVLGVLTGLSPIVASIARAMTRPAFPFAIRMAGARLAAQPAATLRLLLGLALLVLVAGVSSGVLHDMELRSTPTETNYSVQVDGANVANGRLRQRIFDLPARFKWNVQNSVVALAPGSQSDGIVGQARMAGYHLITMSCESLRDLVRRPLSECRAGELYRMTGASMVGTPYEIPPGTEFVFNRGDGSTQTVVVPRERIVVPDDVPFPIHAYGALYLAQDGPAYQWTRDSLTSFLVAPDPAKLSAFKTAVARISPSTQVRVWGEDLDLIELARNQKGVISFGVVMGLLIAILAFGVAAIDNTVERRRDAAVLMAMGMRKRTLRAVQITQLLTALTTVLVASVVAGYLAGNLALRFNDVNRGWYDGPLRVMVPFLAAAIVVALGAGSVVAVRRLRSEDLKRE